MFHGEVLLALGVLGACLLLLLLIALLLLLRMSNELRRSRAMLEAACRDLAVLREAASQTITRDGPAPEPPPLTQPVWPPR